MVSFVLFAIAGPMVFESALFAAPSGIASPWESNARLVWNWRLPLDTAVHPNSDAYRDTLVSALRAQGTDDTAESIWPKTSGFTAPVYVVDSSTPRRPVEVTDCYAPSASTGRTVNGPQTDALNARGGVRIPDGARAAPGPDHDLVVYDTSDDTLYEFSMVLEPYQVINDSPVGPNVQVNLSSRYQACAAGVMANFSSSATGRFIDTPGYSSGLVGAASTGLSYTGGRITPLDLQRGEIRHAIDIALPEGLHAAQSTFPASRSDEGSCPIAQCPAAGQRFRLPADVDLSAITNPFARMVAVALRDYGAIVNDTSGKISMRFDSSVGFTSMGEADPWPVLFSRLGIDYSSSLSVNQAQVRAALAQIPYERLEFLPAAWNGEAASSTATTEPPGVITTVPATATTAAVTGGTEGPDVRGGAVPSAVGASSGPTGASGAAVGGPAMASALSTNGTSSAIAGAFEPAASSTGVSGADVWAAADAIVSAAAAGELPQAASGVPGSVGTPLPSSSDAEGSASGQTGRDAPVIAVNVTGPDGSTMSDLRLSPRNLCRAFTERDMVWNDQLIAADNPGVSLPDLPITPVVPREGSAVARTLAEFCMRQAPEQWTAFMSELPDDERGDYAEEWISGGSLTWPTSDHMVTAAGGDDGSSLAVLARRAGAITFVAQPPVPSDRVSVARLTRSSSGGIGGDARAVVSPAATARRSLATNSGRVVRATAAPGNAVADLRPVLIAVYALAVMMGLARAARTTWRSIRTR